MMNFPIIYFRLLGRPKGVILSHENIVAATSACIVQLGKKNKDILVRREGIRAKMS